MKADSKVVTLNMTTVYVAVVIVIFLSFVLWAGEPDLMDALIALIKNHV